MNPRSLSRRTTALVLAGGVLHAIIALWSSVFVRGGSFSGLFVPETPSGALFVSLTVLGLVLLGGIPVLLFYRYKLVAPAVALVVLFSWAFYSSYRYFEETRETGATSISLYTDSLFGVLWFVPLALVLLAGAAEYVVRRRFDRFPFGALQQ